jgi:hypothetical protein
MNKIILAPNARSGTAGAYFLGRPWRGKRKQDSNSTHELTTVICTLHPDFAKYVSALPRGAAPIVYLIPNILRVIFMNTEIIAPLNTTIWSVWKYSDPRTNNVFLADFNTTGISDASRPHFSTELTSSEAATFSIASAVGDDYENWVDASYIV